MDQIQFCPFCGTKRKSSHQFCMKCGRRLDAIKAGPVTKKGTGFYWCTRCGESFKTKLATCPSCGAHLTYPPKRQATTVQRVFGLLVFVAVIVAIVLGAAGVFNSGGGSPVAPVASQPALAVAAPTAPAKPPTPVPIGTWEHPYSSDQVAPAGDLAWKVLSARQQETALLDAFYDPVKPSGVFIIVQMQVSNRGNSPVTVADISLVDGQHRTFAPSSDTFMAATQPLTWSQLPSDVNPGLSASYYTVFDVPAGAPKLRVLVRDFAFLGAKPAYIWLTPR